MESVTAIVLAGGKNRRLGRNKALEVLGGKSLLMSVIERVKPLVGQILVVTCQEHPDFPISCETEILVDLYPGAGPLGGVYTGLAASKFERSLVVACDMPFLNTRLLNYMLELSVDFDAVVPRPREGTMEPLHAIYSRNCLDKMKSNLESTKREVYSILSDINVRYVDREECQRFDPQLLSFFNINNQSDFDRATEIAANFRP